MVGQFGYLDYTANNYSSSDLLLDSEMLGCYMTDNACLSITKINGYLSLYVNVLHEQQFTNVAHICNKGTHQHSFLSFQRKHPMTVMLNI